MIEVIYYTSFRFMIYSVPCTRLVTLPVLCISLFKVSGTRPFARTPKKQRNKTHITCYHQFITFGLCILSAWCSCLIMLLPAAPKALPPKCQLYYHQRFTAILWHYRFPPENYRHIVNRRRGYRHNSLFQLPPKA